MLLRAGIFSAVAIVGGCLLSIYFLIPAEQASSVVGIAGLGAGGLKDQDNILVQNLKSELILASGEEEEGSFLHSTIQKKGKPSGLVFVTDLSVSPEDLLRLSWRGLGQSKQIQVEVTVGDEEETVLSASLPFPPESWETTEIPMVSLAQQTGILPSVLAGDNGLLRISRVSLSLLPSSQFELDVRGIDLVRVTSRWRIAKAILSAGGLLILALMAIALIGWQIRTERSLQSSNTYYRSIFNAVSEAIFVLDNKNGAVLDVNEKACQIFDYTREEFLKANVEGIVAGTIRRDPLSWIRKSLGSKNTRFEWRGKTRQGEDLWLEFNLRRSAIGGEERLLAVVRDIGEEKRSESERLRLEQQLLHSQKLEAIGQLAGGVAHDFNNILTSISCCTDLALRNVEPRSLPAAGFRQISDLTHRAAALTRQLLAFSRQQALRPTVQSVNQLIENAIKMLTRMIGEDVQLDFRPAADPDTVRVDSGQIEQVLMNLAINARDAMPGGGRLAIETANVLVDRDHPADVEPGAFLKLSVSDSGQGMDQETRERVFEPFFTTKEVGKGTGLGLSTVYGIVRQHRGDILFDSQPGEGTVFHIFLPLANEAAQPVIQEVDEVVPDGSETVLLVEDDPNAREVIERVLKAQGYRVYRAGSAREAKQLFEEYGDEVDLLLTDIVMPGENGVQLHRRLRERNPLVKVLFMSGHTARGSLQNEVLRPGLPFIPKPFGPPELARKIREVLEVGPVLDPTRRSAGDGAHLNM